MSKEWVLFYVFYNTSAYMKLTMNPHANHASPNRRNDCHLDNPLLIYPDIFDNLTARSLPALSDAILADVKVLFLPNLVSLLAYSGWRACCFPLRHAANLLLKPLSHTFEKANSIAFHKSVFANSSCASKIPLSFMYLVSDTQPTQRS